MYQQLCCWEIFLICLTPTSRLIDRAGGCCYWDILESSLHLDGMLLSFPCLCYPQSSKLNIFSLIGALSRSLLDVDSFPTLPTPTITGNIMEEDAKRETHTLYLSVCRNCWVRNKSICVYVESLPFNILLHNNLKFKNSQPFFGD